MIEALSGTTPHVARRFRVESDFAYRRRRAVANMSAPRLMGSQGPGQGAALSQRGGERGMLTSLTGADGLVELQEDTTRLEPGAEVDFMPYSELI